MPKTGRIDINIIFPLFTAQEGKNALLHQTYHSYLIQRDHFWEGVPGLLVEFEFDNLNIITTSQINYKLYINT